MFAPKLAASHAKNNGQTSWGRPQSRSVNSAAFPQLRVSTEAPTPAPALETSLLPRWDFRGISVFSTNERTLAGSASPEASPLQNYPAGTRRYAPSIVQQVVASPGKPLDAPLRREMEQQLHYDFCRLRVHTDAAAAESATAVGARLYGGATRHLCRGPVRAAYRRGPRLLAHELTHAVQQSTAASGADGAHTPIQVEQSDSSSERAACERSSPTTMAPGAIVPLQRVAQQRQPAPAASQPQLESSFTIFVAPDKKRTDKQFAKKEAQADAARIEKAGTLSTDDRHLINAKLRFFEGEAWENYRKRIKPALEKVTQADARAKGEEGVAAFYASERQSQLEQLARQRAQERKDVYGMSPTQIYDHWEANKVGFTLEASSYNNTLKAEQLLAICRIRWGETYNTAAALTQKTLNAEAAKDFDMFLRKWNAFYEDHELDAFGPEFAQADYDMAVADVMFRQTYDVHEYLLAAQDTGKRLTLNELNEFARSKDRIDRFFIGLLTEALPAFYGGMAPGSHASELGEPPASRLGKSEPKPPAPANQPAPSQVAGRQTAPAPDPVAVPAPAAPSRPVAGFARDIEPADPVPAAPAPKRPVGFQPPNAKLPAAVGPNVAPPLSRPVAGFGRELKPRPTGGPGPNDPYEVTQMPPARVMPAKGAGKDPAGGKGKVATWERQGEPAKATAGKPPKGDEPTPAPAKTAGGGGGPSAGPKIAHEDAARVKQLDEWVRKGVVKRGEVAKLRERLQSADEQTLEEARAEFDANREQIESSTEQEPHGWEKHERLPKKEKMSTGTKSELEDSAWLKNRIKDEKARKEFMDWLKKGHKEGDTGPEIPQGQKVTESHEHYPPGAPQTEAKVREWEQTRSKKKNK